MIYTKEQLDAMSDHEVNLQVVKKIGLNFRVEKEVILISKKHNGLNVISIEVVFNPCDIWNDVMPIAEKCDIDVIDYCSTAIAYEEGVIIEVIKKENPKRAICEVFLMMDIDE